MAIASACSRSILSTEAGKRGIRHNDSIPLDQLPDHLIKAALATEDRHFYEHFGIICS